MGSVRQIVDVAGNVTLAKSYEPYGSVLTSTGTASSIFGYAGEQADTTGLIYLRARYMNPRLGIFLAHDPWSGDYFRPGTFNGFNYAGGNPIIIVDPSGRCYPPLEGLRQIEPAQCATLDQALLILGDPRSTPVQRLAPGFYLGLWTTSHAMFIVGAGILTGGGVVKWGMRFLTPVGATEAAQILSEHPNAIAEVGSCIKDAVQNVEQWASDVVQSAASQQYPGFTPEENMYIQQALSNPAENGQLTCHSASLCGLDVLSPLTMVPDSTGALMQDPSFKLVCEYPPNALVNQLKPGDLLTYYAPNFVKDIEDLGLPVHSNRVLQMLDGIVYTFDKLGPRLNFAKLSLPEVLKGIPGLIKVLVYRR